VKITAIEAYPFGFPIRQGNEFTVTYGTLTSVENVAIKVSTDEGYSGWGEATTSRGTFYFSGESQGSVRAALKIMAPQLLGQDASNINEFHQLLNLTPRNMAKCAIEIALHDIIGKKLNVPVYKLLGGALKTNAPMSYTIGMSSPKEMAAQALKKVEEGFRTIEMKVGRYQEKVTVEDDVARVKAVKDAVGSDVILIVDANAGWSVRQALQVINQIEESDVLVEQPTRYLEGLQEVRRRTSVPIIADESCQGLQDTVRLIRSEAADMISMKLTKFDGYYDAMRVLALCEAFSMEYRYDNVQQTRLGATAALHLALATRGIPSGGTAFMKYTKDLVKSGGIQMNKGVATLEDADSPGLGVTLAEELLMPPDVYKL
jgi:L-Ala-D/L-Glu epimerase